MNRIPDAAHHELLNWSRWCHLGAWPHPLPPTKCGSLEANYRAPPDWNPEDEPLPPVIRPNEKHARKVQAIYDALPDDRMRLVIQAEYPGRHKHDGRVSAAHAIGLSVRVYEDLLGYVIHRVEHEFEGVKA